MNGYKQELDNHANTTWSFEYIHYQNYTTKGYENVKSDDNLRKPVACPLHAENEIAKDGSDYDCKCKDGYRTNGTECVNINECEERSHTCEDDNSCIDTDGAFVCSCKGGLSWDGTECVVVKECGDESTDGETPCIPGSGSRAATSGINFALMALGMFVLLMFLPN